MMIVLLVDAALACGGLVTSLEHSDQLAASDALQAILDVGADGVSVEYRVHYTGNAEDFAWILPIPGEVVSVEEGSEDRFDALTELTAPLVNYYEVVDEDEHGGGGFFGCGGAKNDLAGGMSDSGAAGRGLGVSIEGQGYAGDFAYTIIAAQDSAAFADWLTAQGYDTTYAAGPIADYVADPLGFRWVAVQLRPDVATTPEGGVEISPLRVRYGAAADGQIHVVYPSRMASTIQLAEVRTELYVVADGVAEAGNGWTTNTDAWLGLGYGADPVEGYADHLRAVGGDQRGLVEVWRGPWTDEAGVERSLTRLDSIVAPSTNTADIVLDVGAPASAERAFVIDVGNSYYGALPPLALIGLASAAWGLRRRRGGS